MSLNNIEFQGMKLQFFKYLKKELLHFPSKIVNAQVIYDILLYGVLYTVLLILTIT